MRIGVVSKWFNRGQPVVGRQTRSALEQLGHRTFVLARPKKERGPRPGALDRDDVWDQPGVTEASAYEIPLGEYLAWIEENAIEAVFCDQNYQFAELAELRGRGVRTIGRFVWEHFAPEHVAGARDAFEIVFSLTRAEQQRYAELGIDSPYIPWGCHPELLAIAHDIRASADPREPLPGTSSASRPGVPGLEERRGLVRYVFPGGFLGHRKPLAPVLEAFQATNDPRLRLLITAQVERKQLRPAEAAAERDPRIELQVGDLPTDEHLRRLADCDVILAPARWEGLGLPLYEAIAFGIPAITNDAPPMNEAIHDGVNGLLVDSHEAGTARSGITALEPDVGALTAAIERLAGDDERSELGAGAIRVRDRERRWDETVRGLGELLGANG